MTNKQARKVAFITGASRGIGAESAVALAKAGWAANKLWYFLRVNPSYGTMEMRAPDSVPCVEDTVALVALFQALARALDRGALEVPDMSSPANRLLAQENIDRAMCYGTNETTATGEPVRYFDHNLNEKTLHEIVSKLVDILDEDARVFRAKGALGRIRCIARHGNASERQYEQFKRAGRHAGALVSVTRHMVAESTNF